jgi:hypothetical protein
MRLSSSGKRSAATDRIKVMVSFQRLHSVGENINGEEVANQGTQTKTAARKQLFLAQQ